MADVTREQRIQGHTPSRVTLDEVIEQPPAWRRMWDDLSTIEPHVDRRWRAVDMRFMTDHHYGPSQLSPLGLPSMRCLDCGHLKAVGDGQGNNTRCTPRRTR